MDPSKVGLEDLGRCSWLSCYILEISGVWECGGRQRSLIPAGFHGQEHLPLGQVAPSSTQPGIALGQDQEVLSRNKLILSGHILPPPSQNLQETHSKTPWSRAKPGATTQFLGRSFQVDFLQFCRGWTTIDPANDPCRNPSIPLEQHIIKARLPDLSGAAKVLTQRNNHGMVSLSPGPSIPSPQEPAP